MGAIASLLAGFAQAFAAIFGFLQQKQLIDAGKGEAVAATEKETINEIAQAKAVDVAVADHSDPAFDRRLQDRFDRDASR